ncbi:sensor histidine kinase [Paenibacillus sp. CMAA1364]
MRLRDWINTLKISDHWILLLCMNAAFFTFLAWVADSEIFKLLVGVMIVFSVASIMMGILLDGKGKKKKDKAFYDFLREPSREHEYVWINMIGEIHTGKVNELANKLRMLNDQLDEVKLQTRDYTEFIDRWVHEIKTPISLLTLVVQNRREEMSELVYQRLEHARININDNVEQILFYARLQAAHIDYCLERISLDICCEDVLLELQALLDEQEVQMVDQMEDIPIVSDTRALQFILSQVLVNAVKYKNEEVQSFIWLKSGLDSLKNRYYLTIADNGIGVLDCDLPFIFDKGFTGDNSNRKQSTGMGLYLVKKLCEEL